MSMLAPLRLALASVTALGALVAAVAAEARLHASRIGEGVLAPFSVERCCGNGGEIVPAPGLESGAQALRLHWAQANYRGDRESRGVEVVGPRATQNEMWFGYRFLIPASFPDDKNVIIGQLICWEKTAPTNKTLSLSLQGGRLNVSGFFADREGARNPTRPGELVARGLLSPAVPRERWVDVVVHARLSSTGDGLLRVWFDGAPAEQPTFVASGIKLGVAHFAAPDQPRFGPYPKAGMYCWDAPNYSPGETREFWLDALAFHDGAHPDGHRLVAPSPASRPSTPAASAVDQSEL
jgi:hypothetical protein